MPEFSKPLSYTEHLQKVQRLARSAQYRTDPKLAIRELCEALAEITDALLAREQAPSSSSEATPQGKAPSA
jgi:hypothetical protein